MRWSLTFVGHYANDPPVGGGEIQRQRPYHLDFWPRCLSQVTTLSQESVCGREIPKEIQLASDKFGLFVEVIQEMKKNKNKNKCKLPIQVFSVCDLFISSVATDFTVY